MSPLLRIAKKVHLKASRNWLVLVYIAIIATATLVLVAYEAFQKVGK